MGGVIRLTEAQARGAGFEQPFEMLEACHERVHRMLALLHRLRRHVATHGADEAARQAARDVMRYFDLAAPQHHLDEERHVLPALEASGDPELAAVAKRLRSDHRDMEAGWARAGAVLAALAEGGAATLSSEQDQLLAAFAALYGEHIRVEEGVAYPSAAGRLDSGRLQAMADDMRRRRGVV